MSAVTALPGHVVIEAYAVLTRLPSGLAVPSATVARVLAQRFPEPPLLLDTAQRGRFLEQLAAAGVFGGATYDGLVALEAHNRGLTLLTLDERAQLTYARLGVAFELLTG